jgi:hypothetical protein
LLALTAAVGLVHGLGFSFALRQMLQLDGPHLAVSLGAFNVGVELGQIGFALGAWVLIAWLATRATGWHRPVRVSIACACIAIAGLWMVERGAPIFTAVT